MCGYDVVTDYRAARRALGVVPQEALVARPFFLVRETLRSSRATSACARTTTGSTRSPQLGLADKADSNMRALSGGMKRRVLVAQALVHRPPVIVLD